MKLYPHKFVSVRQVAEMMSFKSVSSVWRLKAKGDLPKPVKIAGSTRWIYAEIEEYLDACVEARNKA
jgi:predicted DNA-binding transcriptional regulator AlpA